MENWTPTAITGIIMQDGGSTSALLVSTDCGKGFLKLVAECNGVDALVCEYVGTRLARILDIPTPDFCCLKTDKDFQLIAAQYNDFPEISSGFISRFENARTPNSKSINEISNKEDIAKLVFLDTWIRDPDRYFDGTPNWRNLLIVDEINNSKMVSTLKVIDHDRAFRLYAPEIDTDKTALLDTRVFGLFNEFVPLLNEDAIIEASRRLFLIERDLIEDIFLEIPASWQVDAAKENNMIDFLMKRAEFVAINLPKVLIRDSLHKLNYEG